VPDPKVLLDARFNPKVKSYWLLSGTLTLTILIIGIPLLPVWWILGQWITGRYLASMTCTLTERSLKVSRGVFVRREMTVPLDKITDVGLVEGPIMRAMDLQALRIETAGQSTAGAAVQLVGVENGRAFRDAVLAAARPGGRAGGGGRRR
jgi:putative membrane protein